MNTQSLRSAVFGAIETWGNQNYPDIPIIFENGPVPDEDKIGPIWIDCEIHWYGSQTVSMGLRPRGRETGAVSINVFYRDAKGTLLSDQIMDSLTELFRNKRFASAVTEFPQRTTPTQLRGWYKTGRLVPFRLDIE